MSNDADNTGGLGVVGSNPAAPTNKAYENILLREMGKSLDREQNGTESPEKPRSGAQSPEKVPNWRQHVPVLEAEFADVISADHSRQVRRSMLRTIAKAEIAQVKPIMRRVFGKKRRRK